MSNKLNEGFVKFMESELSESDNITRMENSNMKRILKKFVKGKKLPEGTELVFYDGIDEDIVYDDYGRNPKKYKVYEKPSYSINRGSTKLFVIEVSDRGNNYIDVFGDYNVDTTDNWDDVISIGMNFYENGY